jgi:hypothetical protein
MRSIFTKILNSYEFLGENKLGGKNDFSRENKLGGENEFLGENKLGGKTNFCGITNLRVPSGTGMYTGYKASYRAKRAARVRDANDRAK